jgi:2-(1,2-epoxy-1,2-dihydrophenyl)acetyl-CoA isomerase
LIDAYEKNGNDPDIAVILLAGAGRAFCAGADVNAIAGARSLQAKLDWMRWGHRLPLAISNCGKVTIAAVQGAAMGAGLALALCCDFRIAARGARFGAAFVKIGLATDFGVAWHLPRLIGPARAREFLLSGDVLDGDQAAAIGLATRVEENGTLGDRAQEWAQRFAAGPRLAYAATKRSLQAAETLGLAELMEQEIAQQAALSETDDHK